MPPLNKCPSQINASGSQSLKKSTPRAFIRTNTVANNKHYLTSQLELWLAFIQAHLASQQPKVASSQKLSLTNNKHHLTSQFDCITSQIEYLYQIPNAVRREFLFHQDVQQSFLTTFAFFININISCPVS